MAACYAGRMQWSQQRGGGKGPGEGISEEFLPGVGSVMAGALNLSTD